MLYYLLTAFLMIGNGSFNSSPDYRKWMLNQFQQNTLLLCIKKSFRRCFTFRKFWPNLKNVLMYLFSVHLYFYHNKSLRRCKNHLSSCLPNHIFSRCVQIFDLHCNEKFNFVGKVFVNYFNA